MNGTRIFIKSATAKTVFSPSKPVFHTAAEIAPNPSEYINFPIKLFGEEFGSVITNIETKINEPEKHIYHGCF